MKAAVVEQTVTEVFVAPAGNTVLHVSDWIPVSNLYQNELIWHCCHWVDAFKKTFWHHFPWLIFVCVCVQTLILLSRLSRELMSSPSLQACRHEITFWLSIFPGRMVSPERLPRKYWVNRGLVTSPPTHSTQHVHSALVINGLNFSQILTKSC